jgi:diaminohydroxyphosphoribosylaminopyrimidine deaminase/5-amino-6-(5-phosphoribosylamino)uracil reductase
MLFMDGNSAISDSLWMQLAIDEARKGVGLTSPNPAVGAVIVKK